MPYCQNNLPGEKRFYLVGGAPDDDERAARGDV
jgi:hypothetical protein